MGKHIIFYITFNFIIFQLLSLENIEVEHVINIVCVLAMSSIGIAHGAIDHILSKSTFKKSDTVFISRYLLAMIIIAIVWFWQPNLGVVLFLLISALHFGQTQLIETQFDSKYINYLMQFSWGVTVLSSLLHFNRDIEYDANKLVYGMPPILSDIMEWALYSLIVSSIILFVLFIIGYQRKVISVQGISMELYLLTLIFLSGYFLPPLVAFALFFVLIHSLKAISQEYSYCLENKLVNNIKNFIRKLLPLTIVSLIGTFIILGLYKWLYGLEDIPILIFVLISSITVPHTVVMDKFYYRNN